MSDLFVRKNVEGEPHRNPARIPHMIQLMHAVWAIEGSTEMRMGQLLTTAARMGGWSSDDIFHCEDEIFAAGFIKMLKEDTDG